ncbi:hypothetical protein HYW53_04020 [Candidatus Giovannonibacteria bacterium]|nr:hypothetical protein [Candidatus Giovannonibacteria bacterium]
MLTRRKRKILFWVAVFIFFALTPFVILYSLGYRIDSNFQLYSTGGIYISSSLTGSEIYINSELKRTTNFFQSGIFVQDLSPGIYEVMIRKEGYNIWKKNLKVASQFVTEARSLLVPKEANARVLLRGAFVDFSASSKDPILLLVESAKNARKMNFYLPQTNEFLIPGLNQLNPEFRTIEIGNWLPQELLVKLDAKYYQIRFDLNQRTFSLETIADPLITMSLDNYRLSLKEDAGEDFEITWNASSTELKARWLRDRIPPYYLASSTEPLMKDVSLRNFDFFPQRRDVLIASYDNGIWAVELDNRERQAFPLYKGRKPEFAVFPFGEMVYVFDDGVLMEISTLAREDS